jgi:hypothetical protein
VMTLGGDLRYRGAWDGDRTYRPGDVVTHGGRGFVAKVGMTAASPVEPEAESGWWDYWDALAGL